MALAMESRFVKLQDLLVAKLFPLIVKVLDRDDPRDTIIDQLNKRVYLH
jgi:hypothetical protein